MNGRKKVLYNGYSSAVSHVARLHKHGTHVCEHSDSPRLQRTFCSRAARTEDMHDTCIAPELLDYVSLGAAAHSPAFVLLLIVTGVSAFFDGYLISAFLIFISVYGLYLLIASVATAAQLGWKYLPPLPLAFMAMQLCFGVGFLVGIIRSKH